MLPAGGGGEGNGNDLRFRGNPANPNYGAVTHLLRVYAGHLGLGFAEVEDMEADIHWDLAPPREGGPRLALPGRPHAAAELACARTRAGYPVPASAAPARDGNPPPVGGSEIPEILDAAGSLSLRRMGDVLTADWDLLSFLADILFRRADFLPERAREAREAVGRGQWDEAFGLGEAPWVDRWMFRLLGHLPRLAGALATLPGRGRIWLTHDLDNLAKWRARSVAGQILRTPFQLASGRAGQAVRAWRQIASRALTGRDPYDVMDAVLALERGRRSANFFLVNGRDHLFHRYDLREARHLRVLRACQAAGMDVGLHGQVHFISDAAAIRAEKEKLEGLAAAPVRLNRQHYLRWDPAVTYPALVAAGIEADSTLGYNDMPGFRCGTALPYPWYDCAAGRPLPLLVVPLILGEFQIYDPAAFDPAVMRATVRRYLDASRAQGGVFTVLFHNQYFQDEDFPGLAGVYADLLATAEEHRIPDFDPLAARRTPPAPGHAHG